MFGGIEGGDTKISIFGASVFCKHYQEV